MPGTFSQIYIQIVFAVRGREKFNQVITGKLNCINILLASIKGKEQKAIIVNGMPDQYMYLLGYVLLCE